MPFPILPVLLLGGAIAAAAALSSKKSSSGPGQVELDANLPQATAAQVIAAIANEKDPNTLIAMANAPGLAAYPLTKAALLARAAALQATTAGPTPANANVPQLDPGIDGQTAAAILQALATETNPSNLQKFAASIQGEWPIAAALLNAKATALSVIPGTSTPATPGTTTVIDFTPQEIVPGQPITPALTPDENAQVLALLNDWLRANEADPRVSFVDLSWWRDQPSDLSDPGNVALAVDALQALAPLDGYQVPPGGVAGTTAGTLDAFTLASLFGWAVKVAQQPNPPLTVDTSTLAPLAMGLNQAIVKAIGDTTGTVTAGAPRRRTGSKRRGRRAA